MPWWGNPPGWESEFLARAAAIDNLRPILVGDAARWLPNADLPRIPCTMDEFELRASEVSGVRIRKSDPHYFRGQLLCELRPVMADMYPEAIAPYPWWGYGDWDVVWGDWDSFLTDGILSQFDAISTNARTINGPLQLFRNAPRINALYRSRTDLLRRPTGDGHLDESGMEAIVAVEAGEGRMRCLYPAGVNAHDRHERWSRCTLRGNKLYRMDRAGNVGGEILKFHFPAGKCWPVEA